ncbi:helix-turn-helix transcriptional regulator [Enterobacteriaceae bacterium BIT-l23]|uniref:AraC family transcriptional regulator n=1 Tax=Jejubacter sp. L23 TaxID=3092086 RepID=UPI0015847DA7|nr:helix-turn-helix transcriptional regulator [Enterobacteriaceae bacterium BIT-l23]
MTLSTSTFIDNELSEFTGDIHFRHFDLAPSEWTEHSHPWGQLNYVSQGVMQLNIEGENFLSPPHYAIWIPPGFRHQAVSRNISVYRSIYLSQNFSARLPVGPCAISVSELLKAILNEFARLKVCTPSTSQQLTMAQVALDQIEASTQINAYLPCATTETMQRLLAEVKENLRNKMSTEEVASKFHMSPRTLERKCIAELGISFGEWQKRARYMKAFEGLTEGLTIQQIAWELGYSSPSVFINMFKKLTGITPERYRKNGPLISGERS